MKPPLSAESRRTWLSEAVEHYETQLMAYALRMLNGHREAAQDAVQETFLRLCRAPAEELEGRLAPWLFAVCRSRVIDMKRSSGHHESNACALPIADPAPGPEQRVQTDEEAARLQRLVRGLPDRQREVLHLRLQAGLSYREIAEVTGLSVTNVGYHLHAAVCSLRAQMTAPQKNQSQILGTK